VGRPRSIVDQDAPRLTETPEQKARREIDAKLTAAGWLVQGRDALERRAHRNHGDDLA
jgi:hypothetical protein